MRGVYGENRSDSWRTAKRMEQADIQKEIQNILENLNKEGDKRNGANP